MFREAQELINAGLLLLPASTTSKTPIIKWKAYQETPPRKAEYEKWFQNKRNLWMMTGSASGVVVLDCDNQSAIEFWHGKIGPLLESTTTVKTRAGYHYWFKLPDGVKAPSWSRHPKLDEDKETTPSYDVRGDGTGVMVPPSVSGSGHTYEFVRDIDCLMTVPDVLLSPIDRGSSAHSSTTRSMLTGLLESFPHEGGRNVWLTQVAGHLAAMVRFEDAYRALMGIINDSLVLPLDDTELEKITTSIWETETDKPELEKKDQWSLDDGYLIGSGSKLFTMCAVKSSDDDVSFEPKPVCNFDLVAIGKVLSDDDKTSYQCELRISGAGARTIPLTLTTGHFATTADMKRLLLPYGCFFTSPAGDIYAKTPLQDRLAAYVTSQDVPVIQELPRLGWYPDIGYVTHEGVLGANGAKTATECGVIPRQDLKQWAPYRYGYGNRKQALSVLSEVMNFHDPEVCAVFGSWWVMCVLKEQVTSKTSLFPFIAIEAPSESGKTTGFFSLMIQLNGSTEGHGEYTSAAMRDRVSAHSNGIVWVDDVTDTFAVFEIVRQATSGGVRSKKGQDKHSQETVKMVSPIVLTGESMSELNHEKALQDRAIHLKISTPVNRKSAKGSWSQWEDIVALKADHPDLTKFAGDLVMEILKYEDRVDTMADLRVGSGRHADKLSIIRAGARILAEMIDDPTVVDRVDHWASCQAEEYDQDVNHLLLRIIPTWLTGASVVQNTPAGGPVIWIHNGQLAFSIPKLSSWWESLKISDRDKDLGSATSIKEQQKKLTGTTTIRKSILSNRSRHEVDQQARYVVLSAEDTMFCAARAGLDYGSNHGSAPGKTAAQEKLV